MKIRRYEEKDKEIVAKMITELSMKHVRLLNKVVDRDKIYQEILAEIDEFNTGKHKLYVGIEEEKNHRLCYIGLQRSECLLD